MLWNAIFTIITWLLQVWIYIFVLTWTRFPQEQAIHNFRRNRGKTQETILLTKKILAVCHYILGDRRSLLRSLCFSGCIHIHEHVDSTNWTYWIMTFFFKKKVEYMNFPGRFVLLGSLIWKGKIEGYIDIDKYVDVYLYIEINI